MCNVYLLNLIKSHLSAYQTVIKLQAYREDIIPINQPPPLLYFHMASDRILHASGVRKYDGAERPSIPVVRALLVLLDQIRYRYREDGDN